VEHMTRADLEHNYFNAVYIAEYLLDAQNPQALHIQYALREEIKFHKIYGRYIGTQQDGLILAALMTRKVCTLAHLSMVIKKPRSDTVVSHRHLRVVVCGLRKALAPLNIHIKTIHSQGYALDEKSIDALKNFLKKHNIKKVEAL
jgi:DNA-binding response OmpR family regulator